MTTKKRLDSTMSVDLILANITVPILFKRLMDVYAEQFSNRTEWKDFLAIADREALNKAMIDFMKQLRAFDPVAHAGVCGVLTIVSLAATTKSIKKFTRNSTERNEITKKYFVPDLFNSPKTTPGGIAEPFNMALWFSIRAEIKSQWETIVQMATTEQHKRISWTTFEIGTPTVTDKLEIEANLKTFEAELKKHFSKSKPVEFQVEALPSIKTEKFQRYIVSTNKDPQMTRLVKPVGFANGFDDTANTFLVDHYYNADILRVMDPDVVDEQVVADLFTKHVLKCKVKEVEQKYFNVAMRPYIDRATCEKLLTLTAEEKKDIESIALESIVFTCAKNIEEAEQRRYATVEKKGKGSKLPKLPRFGCEGYHGPSIFDEIDHHFRPDDPSCPIGARDVVSLCFAVNLYVHKDQGFLSEADRMASEKTKRYHIEVSGKKASLVPAKWEIKDTRHASLMRYIKDEKLGFIGLSFDDLKKQYISERGND